MFTSVNSKKHVKRALIYLAISAFLVVFNIIYGLFSHGVTSRYMQLVFLVPLLGGTFPSLMLMYIKEPHFIIKNLWRMGLSSIIIGFLLRGVFDIYGTEVHIINWYVYIGGSLLLCSLLIYIYSSYIKK